LIGGSLTSGLLCVLLASLVSEGNIATVFDDGATVFAHPLLGAEGAWFFIGGATGAAFVLGTFLGLTCLLGDSVGSFAKRRRGLKREGDVSSKAPLLDTLPFAIMVFLCGQLFLGPSVLASEELRLPMLGLVLITPVLHRSFNLIGYKIGWKDVPY
jgi:CDP-2,3-bis-(O-geranylgeranyl)-sn-glycerol synthase